MSHLVEAAEKYFDGLRRKDMTQVPWDEDVIFFGPLTPKSPEPIRGRSDLLAYFSTFHHLVGEIRIEGHFPNPDGHSIVTRAVVEILNPACRLRLTEYFEVDAEGNITFQENYYDASPLLSSQAESLPTA